MKHKCSIYRRLLPALITLLCLLAGGAGITYWQYDMLKHNMFCARDNVSHGYYIYPGASADSVLALIVADYEFRSPMSWRQHCRHYCYTTPRAGYYRFAERMGSQEVIMRLMQGKETPVRLTFTNTLRTRHQLASRLGKQLLTDSATIACRLDSADYMAKYGLTPETAVCMFLPDTYEVYWTTDADRLFNRMAHEYEHFWTKERREKAAAIGLTPQEVTTLASIVESETNRKAEYPIIASLYLNRLRTGMHLQACPTAIFASGEFGLRRVLHRHIAIDSPYNTYRYIGLPPGPIRCTRALTIDSVLAAPKTNYLYMCANPDFSGTHVFSSSYSQHAATARRYQQELNRRKIH